MAQRRSFVMYLGNKTISKPIVPPYRRGLEMVFPSLVTPTNESVALLPASEFTFLPIVSPIEVYRVFAVSTAAVFFI